MDPDTLQKGDAYRNAVFEAANDMAFITTDLNGLDSRILDFSPGAEHIFGYRRGEIIGKKFSILYSEEDELGNFKFLTQVSQKKPGLTTEVFLNRKSGERFPAIYTRYPVHDNHGKLIATLGVAVDISRRKQIENAIKYAHYELRQLFNTAVDGMRVIDKNFNMIRISKTFLALSGTTLEKAKGKKCYEVLRGSLCHTPMCPLSLIINGEKYVEYEVEKKRDDGIKIPCILTATPFKAPEGDLIGIVEHFKDITLRNESAEELLRSKRRYSTVVDNSLTGIYIEIDGKIEFANRRLKEIFGCEKDDIIGMEFQKLIHPDHQAFTNNIRLKLFDGEEKASEFEIKCITLNNQVIWVKMRDTCIEYEGKMAILGNLVEITERKRMEGALVESEKTLKILSSHLFTAQEDERKRLAHELHDGVGQFLSAIKFCAENLLKQPVSGTAVSGSESLGKIVSLTQYAIEEVRKISMDLRPSTLDDLGILATIAWFCREFQSIYSSIRIEQHMDIHEDDVPSSIKTVIFRVMQEALSNVARHSKADFVCLSLRKTKSHIELVIEDNGIGFDLRESKATRSLIKGFGLAGMRERVEFVGGIFIVMSMKGEGTFIRAKWPIQDRNFNP